MEVKKELPPEGGDAFSKEELSTMLQGELQILELLATSVGDDWIVLQRKRFDLTLFEEPYHAVQLLVDLRGGRYIRRLWGRTHAQGEISSARDFSGLCFDTFLRTVPCLGFFDLHNVFPREDFEATGVPVQRLVSKRCRQFYQFPEEDPTVTELLGIGLCAECLGRPKLEVDQADDHVAQVFKACKEEEDEDEDYEDEASGTDSTGEEEDEDDEEDFSAQEKEEESSTNLLRNDYSGLVTRENGRKVYQCPRCEKRFLCCKSLNLHRKRHHLFGPFLCAFCDVLKREYADELLAHFAETHPDRRLTCPCCSAEEFGGPQPEDKLDSSRDFVTHYRLCYRRAARAETRAKGKKQIRSKAILCELCGKSFVSRATLKGHLDWHNGIKSLKCTECDFATSRASSLYTHNKIHLREKGLDRTENDIPIIFNCAECTKTFNSAHSLKEHRLKVHEGKLDKRVCEMCGLVFTNRTNLRRHKARSHAKDGSRQCGICGYMAADNSGFVKHQRVHKEGDYICRFCAKALKSKQTLLEHERAHTGEMPFKCETCGYECKSRSVLRRHVVLHHERPPPPGKERKPPPLF